MNRNAEFLALRAEIDAAEAPGGAVERAVRRNRRRRLLVRPAATLAAIFAVFAVLVNASATVAYACARVPVLRELAEAVRFSRSLSDAVENDYMQPVGLTRTEGGIKATVEYLIVDQRNVTVFYRLDSTQYTHLIADPEFRAEDGAFLSGVGSWTGDVAAENGELRSATADFVGGDVPPRMRLVLKVRDVGAWQKDAPAVSVWDAPEEREPEYAAEFDFLLEFDPYFTEQGKHFAGGQSFVIDGQTLYVRSVDVYPSYLSFTVEGDSANSAWLEHLTFYLVTDRGQRFDAVSNGVTATGSQDTPDIVSYRADSTFFYRADSITVYLTGAEWRDKAVETIHIDLKNARADRMPENSPLVSVERDGRRWIVTTLHPVTSAQTFLGRYYDPEGREYEITSWHSSIMGPDGEEAPEGWSFESVPLDDYPYDEVWLTPRYTDVWTAEEPVAVEIALK